MAEVENWAVATDRKMHDQAVGALKSHKKTLPKQKMHKVDAKTYIVLPADMELSEVKKRIKTYKKYLAER